MENDSTFHTDVDRDLFQKVPAGEPVLLAQLSGHAHLRPASPPTPTAFSMDLATTHPTRFPSMASRLPISRARSSPTSFHPTPFNPLRSSQARRRRSTADKTSLVIVATTRSGQGVTKPTGSITTSYGAFGSATGGFDLGYGGKNWGNFFEVDGLNTGRFLDPPEFVVFHDKGNEQNVFDRVDYQFTPGRFGSPEPELQPLLVPDAELLRQSECAECGERRHRQPTPSSPTSATPISIRRLKPSISRRPTRASSAPTRSSTLAPTFAETRTTTTPAAIPWPILVRQICRPPRSLSTGRSPMPAFTRISPSKGDQQHQGWVRSTRKPS